MRGIGGLVHVEDERVLQTQIMTKSLKTPQFVKYLLDYFISPWYR